MTMNPGNQRSISAQLPPAVFEWLADESLSTGTSKRHILLAALGVFRELPYAERRLAIKRVWARDRARATRASEGTPSCTI